MELIDLDNAPRDLTNYYGGSAGMKYAVVYNGSTWMLKFPESKNISKCQQSKQCPAASDHQPAIRVHRVSCL